MENELKDGSGRIPEHLPKDTDDSSEDNGSEDTEVSESESKPEAESIEKEIDYESEFQGAEALVEGRGDPLACLGESYRAGSSGRHRGGKRLYAAGAGHKVNGKG